MILFRLDAFTTDQLNTLLLDILAVHDRELEQGAIVVVEATGFRVRSLPIWQT